MGIGTIFAFLVLLMIGPPVVFIIVGISKQKTNEATARLFYILATVWLLIGGGICATLLNV